MPGEIRPGTSGEATLRPSSSRSSERPSRRPIRTRSYLGRITDAMEASPLAAFAAFPRKVSFDGQDRGESIVLMVRQHPIILTPKIVKALLILFLPLSILPFLGVLDLNIGIEDVPFGIGVAILVAMIAVTMMLVGFFKWFFTINIITTERVIDIDFVKVYSHTVSEAQLEKIEDVSHRHIGMWSTIFDFGCVYIQTAAEQREFEFQNVPRPRDVQDTILDLLEIKQGDR